MKLTKKTSKNAIMRLGQTAVHHNRFALSGYSYLRWFELQITNSLSHRKWFDFEFRSVRIECLFLVHD